MAGAALGLVGGSLVKVFKKKKAPTSVATTSPQQSPRSRSVLLDALSARRGTLANRRTGSGGVESATGKKTALGQ